jgi:hypothetical protein
MRVEVGLPEIPRTNDFPATLDANRLTEYEWINKDFEHVRNVGSYLTIAWTGGMVGRDCLKLLCGNRTLAGAQRREGCRKILSFLSPVY